ncbi:efflux transporter outer membrane subunit [Ferrimonas lipolytica]|uniref:Efflux transporter outer membrane subunit n=1 Tax=Ferrimonas lipolytica TaxID=2724191 RepID=A0A6H1UCX5_9GAMM|nr:efflux transporter outer membrane subunit [Ferrimonas lipolytica]QIZ76921.1 efflux transporter outer membrane subunit [Ferrimonas lipolytica]
MRNLVSLTVALLLTGCAVGPDYQGPESAQWQPQQWQLNGSQSDLTATTVQQQWWRQFNDPQLDQLVDKALQQNLTVLASQQRVKLAQSYREAVSATNLPQIGLGVGYTAGMLSEQGPIGGPLRGNNDFGIPLASRHYDATYMGGSVGWEPDLFGKTSRLVEATSARAEQVEILADGTRLMVVSAVVNNYLSLRSVQQQQQILQAQLADLDALSTRIDALRQSGLASGIETAQIAAQRASVVAMQPQLDTVVDVHSRRLAILLGQAPSSLIEPLSEAKPMPFIDGAIPIGLPSELLTRRPDIRFAERQMKVANAELGVAIARKYPSFYMTGSPGVAASSFGDLFAGGSGLWSFGVGMNWSLFDGGMREALEAVAESQVDIAAMDYQRTLLTAFGEVETLLHAYGNSQLRLDAAEQSRAQVENAVARTETLVNSGLVSRIELLTARSALHQADANVTQARGSHSQLVVSLYKALGGSWIDSEAQRQADELAQTPSQ